MKSKLIFVLLFAGASAFAGPSQSTRTGSTLSGSYSVTNDISNQQYAPVAALFAFNSPVTGTVAVERISNTNAYLLSSRVVSNATSLVWLPDFECGFAFREALRLSFPPATGSVQVIIQRLP